jgi:REP element-mobilizing transposase RayT
MSTPGMLRRHVIINTFGTWLHGDERGFRSRKHRIHSSGDYRHRPPSDEHAGLHGYHRAKSRSEVTIDRSIRPTIGQTLLAALLDRSYRVLALAVGKVHAHCLVELPESPVTVKAIGGDAKRKSSRAVKTHLPGTVWASGGTFKIVKDDDHLRRANDYILYDQGSDAWTWSFRDRSREGRFARKR